METPLNSMLPFQNGRLKTLNAGLDFSYHRLLRELYLQVGNGGFGPGYGLWGLDGAYLEWDPIAYPDKSIVEAHEASRQRASRGGHDFTSKRITICDWGCCNGSAIDCADPTGMMIFFADIPKEVSEEIGFQQWMEEWANGVDLWERVQGKLKPEA